jgi:hypothetical protein
LFGFLFRKKPTQQKARRYRRAGKLELSKFLPREPAAEGGQARERTAEERKG